jgi:hypothetical protein
MDTFAPTLMVDLKDGVDMSENRNWLEKNVERTIKEMNKSYKMIV